MYGTKVILVSESDEAIGVMDKMEVHRKGLLHRAFSVFIFDRQGRMLLQQRAKEKYHGGLLWSNACCSHPFPEESIEHAAGRRLKEELGFSTKLEEIFSFTYHAEVENGLIEHEFDHVFAGEYEGNVALNPKEVSAVEYKEMPEIRSALEAKPQQFTSWFTIVFPMIQKWWEGKYRRET